MRLTSLLLLSSSVFASHINKRQHNHGGAVTQPKPRMPFGEDLATRHERHAERFWAALAEQELERRQDNAAFPTGQPGFEVYPAASITPLPPDVSTATVALPTQAVAGQSVPVQGAPPLPDFTLNVAEWPNPTLTPDLNSPQVQQWMAELDGYDIPDYGPTVLSTDPNVWTCDKSVNPNIDATENGRCWWTCGGCLRWTDVSVCNDTLTVGLTFDDGPGLYTPKLLHYLQAVDTKATFFVVGAAALYRPESLRAEYVMGHEIAVHTWSHKPLTTLSNAEIVAELGWTREIIKRMTGVTPLMMRPPYGDIDDRVRAISLAMGLRPIIWTREDRPDLPSGELVWDTNDFRVHANQTTAPEAERIVAGLLDIAATNLTTGTLWLEHDLFKETVDLAISVFIPQFRSHNPAFNLMPVSQCLKRPLTDAYLETNTDQSNPAVNPPLAPGDGGGPISGGSSGTASGGTKPTGSKTTGSSGANPTGAGQGGDASARMSVSAWAVLLAGAIAFFA